MRLPIPRPLAFLFLSFGAWEKLRRAVLAARDLAVVQANRAAMLAETR